MNVETQDLWNRAVRALDTASEWAEKDPDAAASRAYYAAFHAVSALFAAEGRSFSKHSGLESAVHKDLVRTDRWSAELGAAYSELSVLRKTGDYGGPTHVQTDEAVEAVAKARGVLDAVKSVLKKEGS